jgi:hypothetical protein
MIRVTDEPAPVAWEWLDHETQLAFRDAAEAVSDFILANKSICDTHKQ